MTRFDLANGGSVIALRAFAVAFELFVAAVVLKLLLGDEHCWRAVAEGALPWFGASLGAVYASLYTRYASQWTYLANIYHRIKETEARGHVWGDIDFRSNLVVLRRSSTRGVVGHTKGGREAKVPLTQSLHAALKAHRHMRSKLVFCNENGSPLSLWQLHERLEMVCRRAGLRRIRWHDLRHSFASQLAANGVLLRQVQAWLNHSTIHMSMRYAHLAPDARAELISVLEHDPHAPRGNGVATK